MTEQTTNEPEVESPNNYTALSTPVDTEAESFDREYVRKLRDEAAGHRVTAERADALAASRVTCSTRTVDEDTVRAAVDVLVKRKPHLAARRPTGNVGQGARPDVADMDLAALLRRGA